MALNARRLKWMIFNVKEENTKQTINDKFTSLVMPQTSGKGSNSNILKQKCQVVDDGNETIVSNLMFWSTTYFLPAWHNSIRYEASIFILTHSFFTILHMTMTIYAFCIKESFFFKSMKMVIRPIRDINNIYLYLWA